MIPFYRYLASIFFVSIVSVLDISAQAKDEMDVCFPTGNIETINLKSVQKITFSEQFITIHFKETDKTPQPISYDTVILFKDGNNSVQTIENDNIQFSIKAPYLIIESAILISDIYAYNLAGIQLLTEPINSYSASISLESLVPGVYIINIKTQKGIRSIKIIK